MSRWFSIVAVVLAIIIILVVIGFRSGVVDFPDGQNILANGDFESGDFTPNCSQRLTLDCERPTADEQPIPGLEAIPPASSTSIPGWTVGTFPGPQNVAWLNQDNPFVGDIASDRPTGGHRFLDLSGYGDHVESGKSGAILQTFATKAGKTYMLFLDIGVFNSSSQPKFAGPITVVATIDNQTLVTCGPFNPSGRGPQWQTCKDHFTAGTGSTTLAIFATAGQAYIGLDKVSVECIAPLGRLGFCS